MGDEFPIGETAITPPEKILPQAKLGERNPLQIAANNCNWLQITDRMNRRKQS
jgi:hypothetical protein